MNDEILKTELPEDKPKQKRPNRSKNMQVQTEPGDNKKYINNAMKVFTWPPIDTNDAVAVTERVCEYFTFCAQEDAKPSAPGLAMALGIERTTLWRWKNGEGKKSEICNTIKRAYQVLDVLMNDYMLNGKINPVSGIFLMNNNFGYKNQQEVTVERKSPLGEASDPNEINSRYIDSIPDDEILIDTE